MKGRPLDRDALHRFLYEKAGRNGKLTVHLDEISEEFGMSRFHLSRVIQEFVKSGQMKLLDAGHRNVKSYVVRPPAEEGSAACSERVSPPPTKTSKTSRSSGTP